MSIRDNLNHSSLLLESFHQDDDDDDYREDHFLFQDDDEEEEGNSYSRHSMTVSSKANSNNNNRKRKNSVVEIGIQTSSSWNDDNSTHSQDKILMVSSSVLLLQEDSLLDHSTSMVMIPTQQDEAEVQAEEVTLFEPIMMIEDSNQKRDLVEEKKEEEDEKDHLMTIRKRTLQDTIFMEILNSETILPEQELSFFQPANTRPDDAEEEIVPKTDETTKENDVVLSNEVTESSYVATAETASSSSAKIEMTKRRLVPLEKEQQEMDFSAPPMVVKQECVKSVPAETIVVDDALLVVNSTLSPGKEDQKVPLAILSLTTPQGNISVLDVEQNDNVTNFTTPSSKKATERINLEVPVHGDWIPSDKNTNNQVLVGSDDFNSFLQYKNHKDKNDDDEATQPETPEKDEFLTEAEEVGGNVSEHCNKKSVSFSLDLLEQGQAVSSNSTTRTGLQRKKNSPKKLPKDKADNDKDQKAKRTVQQQRCRICIILCASLLLSLVLMTSVAILGYNLYAIRNDKEASFFGFDLVSWFKEWMGKEEIEERQNNNHPQPSNNTNFQDVDPELLNMVRDTLVVASGGMDGNEKVPGMMTIDTISDNPSSIQFSVMSWLAKDPSILNYSATKILQRYVLGCFYGSLQDRLSTDANVLKTWLTYDDECDSWMTTNGSTRQVATSTSLCDATTGHVISIHLENVGLSGTLAPELALLSNSLENLYLTGNNIYGHIPSSFGQLTKLKRLQLSRNNITGALPSELGLLYQHLEVFSIGHNGLSRKISSHLGQLTNLMELNLANNALTGSIPQEVSNLKALTIMRLEGNSLGGSIPQVLCNRTTTTNSEISVDCELVQCSCCVNCDIGEIDETLPKDVESAATVLATSMEPTKDPREYPVAPTTGIKNFDCYTIQVGFPCYNPMFAFDFETSVCDPQDYDIVAVFQVPSGVAAPPTLVGAQKQLNTAEVWANSCNLTECDGVVSSGKMYFRNAIPESYKDATTWPPTPGSTFLMATIHVNDAGMATILAQSQPFVVTDQCP